MAKKPKPSEENDMAFPTAVNDQATDTNSQQALGAIAQLGNMALQNAVLFQQAMNSKMIKDMNSCGCKCKKKK